MPSLKSGPQDPQDPQEQQIPAAATAATGTQTRGSVLWAVILTVVGWVVLLPGALVIGAFAMVALGVSPDAGGGLDPTEGLKTILIVASALCAPVILGISVYRKSATWGIIGAFAAIPGLFGLITIASA
ncbi:hypothetical protein ACX80D_16970 [Arthrobacter sp. Sr24]